MKPEIFADKILIWLGSFPVTVTMVTSLAVTIVLLVAGVWLARSVSRGGEGRAAALGRMAFGALRSLVSEAAGQSSPTLEAFAGGLFLFIAGSAVAAQLPGVTAPTSNLGAASALAVLVFVAVPIAGIRAQGVRGYFGHYFKPNPILFPMHVVSELSRTVALALRLFGNMMSGHLVVGLIVALVGFFLPVPLMALDLVIGLLQAYIFTILACVYIGAAMRVGEER